MKIHALPNREGSHLCTITLVRRPDGSIAAQLVEMPPELIETTGEDVASRVDIIAHWLLDGAADMERQAAEWALALGGEA